MEKVATYNFFENKNCKYYPCHKGLKEINCLFCFCPLFNTDKCFDISGNGNCKNCTFPHKRENYKKIIKSLDY